MESRVALLRVPLSEAELQLAAQARVLHSDALGFQEEFPSDYLLTTPTAGLMGVYVHTTSDAVSGYLSVETYSHEAWWYLRWIVVDSDARGRRLGNTMVRVCAVDALAEDIQLLTLKPQPQGDERLLRYWEDRGFRNRPDIEGGQGMAADPEDVLKAIGLDPSPHP